MWPLTRIKNHVSSIIIYVFMPTNAPLSDFGLFWASQIPGGAPNFGPNTKNRWFFGITFNATVRSPNMWYECNFFNAKQIPHQIYEKSMIHYGGRMGGAPCTWWYTSKLNFYVKIETTCLLFLVESMFNHRTAAPPHPPPIMYHGFFIYFMWYLFDTKKNRLVSHVWASNGRIKRNNKKSSIFVIRARFLMDLKFSKQLKIG